MVLIGGLAEEIQSLFGTFLFVVKNHNGSSVPDDLREQARRLPELEHRLASSYEEEGKTMQAAIEYRSAGIHYFRLQDLENALQSFVKASELGGESFSQEQRKWLLFYMKLCK